MSDLEIILVVFAASIAAVVIIGLLKRPARRRGSGESYRDERKSKETDDRTKGS